MNVLTPTLGLGVGYSERYAQQSKCSNVSTTALESPRVTGASAEATAPRRLSDTVATSTQKTKSRDAARPFDPMPPRLRPPGTGTFRLRARPGSARASVSNSPQYVFVLAR